ncbi:MAG TPA: hypothetical protein VGG75_31260 [Trebonia sp.]|jgi:hypothetical protein
MSPPGSLARLRDETCETLYALDAAAKVRASVVRSCTELRGLSAAEIEALKDLLRSITDQRKRMRAVRRVWQSLDAFERPSAELVTATDLCIAECRELTAVLEPWRARSISQLHADFDSTWARLLRTASQFTGSAGLAGRDGAGLQIAGPAGSGA